MMRILRKFDDILMKIDDEADLRPDPPSWRDLNTQMSGKNDNYEGGEHDNFYMYYCMKMIIMSCWTSEKSSVTF